METLQTPTISKNNYTLHIPNNVLKGFMYLNSKLPSTEWSGILFYTIDSLSPKKIELTAKDFLPLDIGTNVYTDFEVTPEVISFMTDKGLLDCKIGLVHNHHNMSTNFSGTDMTTLNKEGAECPHFLSLIVNNALKYSAKLTYKQSAKINVVYKSTFNDKVYSSTKEETKTIVNHINLDVTLEQDSYITEIDTLYDNIVKLKAEKELNKKTFDYPHLKDTLFEDDDYSYINPAYESINYQDLLTSMFTKQTLVLSRLDTFDINKLKDFAALDKEDREDRVQWNYEVIVEELGTFVPEKEIDIFLSKIKDKPLKQLLTKYIYGNY